MPVMDVTNRVFAGFGEREGHDNVVYTTMARVEEVCNGLLVPAARIEVIVMWDPSRVDSVNWDLVWALLAHPEIWVIVMLVPALHAAVNMRHDRLELDEPNEHR